MLTKKRKTTWANSLKSQKKYILNPGHNQQKKRKENTEITTKSQRIHFSTVRPKFRLLCLKLLARYCPLILIAWDKRPKRKSLYLKFCIFFIIID